MTTPPSSLIWAHEGCALVGSGELKVFDPGTGPDRYEKALVALQESGRSMAFASFTFDPDQDGSLVLAPEGIAEMSTEGLARSAESMPQGEALGDGSEDWARGIELALDRLDDGALDKIVLSRQVEMVFEHPVPLGELARRLHSDQPACYTFSVAGLVGASPELLVSLSDGVVSSLALAGTAVDATELQSSKIDREHWYTASSVEAALSTHVTGLTRQERSVVEFGDIKHLGSRFTGPARPGTSVLDVLASLHPTAAVAGTPTGSALALIRETEPAGRGRYAGPVGWFNTEGEGEFAIALRCGLIEGPRVTLYAGGGIVRGSDPASEFEETELKLRPMRQALGLD